MARVAVLLACLALGVLAQESAINQALQPELGTAANATAPEQPVEEQVTGGVELARDCASTVEVPSILDREDVAHPIAKCPWTFVSDPTECPFGKDCMKECDKMLNVGTSSDRYEACKDACDNCGCKRDPAEKYGYVTMNQGVVREQCLDKCINAGLTLGPQITWCQSGCQRCSCDLPDIRDH